MKKITIKSHCKINLGLNIIRKRDDGYHDLETIFYPVGLHDILTFEMNDSFSFATSSPELSLDVENNLIVKAVKILERESGRKIKLAIYLEKNIPMGAGLGGGSSNAAVTLLSVNELLHLGFNKERLGEYALELGSDVPYFLRLKPAYAESRGEKLQYLDFEIPLHLLIVNPGIHISTKWAYENITPATPECRIAGLIHDGKPDLQAAASILKNDFEAPVFRNYPEIGEIKMKMIENGAAIAMMSGSGSSVFGFFADLKSAQRTEEEFANRFFTALDVYEN